MNKLSIGIKRLSILLAFVLVLSILAPIGQTAEAATVKINKKTATIREGSSIKLSITGTKNKVTWKSADDTIAKVSSNGKISGKNKGETTITATVNKKKYKCVVIVKKGKIDKPYDYFSYEMNSVNGIKVYWQADNNTGKKINYYTVNFKFTNAVGDPAYDEITGESTSSIKYVGPVKKGDQLLVFSIIGYIPVLDKLSITSIDLIYSDKTKETIEYNYSTTRDEIEIDFGLVY